MPEPNKLRGIHFEGYAGEQTSGTQFYVLSTDANAVDDTAHGKDPSIPFATIDYAIGRCTANNGDVINVLPGHAETIAAANAIALDVAGVWIKGQGTGTLIPTITAATSTAAELDVSAANCRVSGLRFVCNIASQTAMVSVAATGDGFVLENCRFEEGSATGLNFVTLADADRVKIRNCEFLAPTAGNYDDAISIDAALDALVIEGCWIKGDFDDAGIHNPTGNVATNILIKDCIVENQKSGDHAIELVSACTGHIVNCSLAGDTAGAILDPGSCRIFNTPQSTAIDTPAGEGDSGSNILGADNSNNAFASTNVAVNADGSIIERLESLQQELSGTAGIASWAVGAAPANAVSLAEGVRDIWDAVRNGTGGSEPATNKSIIDALGFDGSAFVAGGLAKYLPQCVVKSDGAVLSGSDDLFTVVGVVKCKIFGLVTTVIGGAANGKLQITTTVPSATVDLNAGAVAIDTDAAGTFYRNVGATSVFTPSSTLGYVLSDPVTVEETDFLLSAGTVKFNSSAAQSGVIAWYCEFTPLTPGASVTAAA